MPLNEQEKNLLTNKPFPISSWCHVSLNSLDPTLSDIFLHEATDSLFSFMMNTRDLERPEDWQARLWLGNFRLEGYCESSFCLRVLANLLIYRFHDYLNSIIDRVLQHRKRPFSSKPWWLRVETTSRQIRN